HSNPIRRAPPVRHQFSRSLMPKWIAAAFVVVAGLAVAVGAPDLAAQPKTDKGPPPKFLYGHDLKVRPGGQRDWYKAAKIGLEVFKDENTGGLVYITETGSVATAAAPAVQPDPKKVAPPKPVYGLTLRVRGADEPDFTDKTKKYGVEVFEDPNANTLFYISETGSIAVVPNLP